MLRLPRLRNLDESLTVKFVLPVIMENSLTIFIGLAISQIISTISSSALAAIGMANTIMTVVSAFFSMVTTGTSIMVARQIGARENQEAAESIEQSTFMSAVATILIMIVCITFASPILRLLMPTAEDSLFGEAVGYFRVIMTSLPFLVLHGVFSGVCRGLGNSRMPMITAIAMNLCQLLVAWITISCLQLNEIGAGVAIVVCRVLGTAILFITLMRDHRRFVLKVRNMLRPNRQTCMRILRIGVPVSFESVFVQLGYMLGNSMAISLGTFESGVYQIINTVNTFTSLPQGIGSTIATSAVGHLLGRKNYKGAKKAGWTIWALGLGFSLVLGLAAYALETPISSIYSEDPATIAESARLLWILIFMNATGMSINAIDPQLRVGGDVKYVMTTTLIAVWGIRLPLTYFMCFHWNFGVLGIFLANTISLVFRTITGLVRYCGTKWMYKKV